MKIPNGHEVIQLFESFSPKYLAEDGDPIGLQVGTLSKKISKVQVVLDVTEEVVDEAIANGADMILAHHPFIFRPLKKIDYSHPHGRVIEKLIKHDITLYAAHTNLDVAEGGVNDLLAEALELKELTVLSPTHREGLKKLAVYVPAEAEEKVREALARAGAGNLGHYSHCSFSAEGIGRFKPDEHADPHIGSRGKLEAVKEVKVEVVVPELLANKVVRAMLNAHPYEEVAYDLYTLDNQGVKELGLGRVGLLPEAVTLREFAEKVKKAFEVDTVRVTGDLTAQIKKVAVLGGTGDKFVRTAQFKGADVFVTGDIYYHTAVDFLQEGMNIIDPGHNVEKIMKKGVASKMADLCAQAGFEVEWSASVIDTDPFQVV
ncbi:Nif3-like dinuclear metal center hexameric protein [Pradoshia sp.]